MHIRMSSRVFMSLLLLYICILQGEGGGRIAEEIIGEEEGSIDIAALEAEPSSSPPPPAKSERGKEEEEKLQ